MCGIVGYVGNRPALGILIEGLKRLEYRGYDSAGVAIIHRKRLKITKRAGRVHQLEPFLKPLTDGTGIAHTRWATHGKPTDINSHPHTDPEKIVAIVHNGVIENYHLLKEKLQRQGAHFETETDTEVIAHLIAHFYKASGRRGDADALEESVGKALALVEGTYGLAVIAADCPGHIIAARNGSPLIVGVGERGMFVASDVGALVSYTRQVFFLEDREMAHLTPSTYQTRHLDRGKVEKPIEEIPWDLEAIEKKDFPDFMLKEIFEQPESITRCFLGRLVPEFGTVKLGGLSWSREEALNVKRIQIIGCGTSFNAGLAASYIFENLSRIPCRVDIASEYRYRNPVVDRETFYLAVSQSGETADTLAALREIKIRGGNVSGICNGVGSSLARESDGGVYIHAGPEVAVASTKCFTSELLALEMIAIDLGRMRHLSPEVGRNLINEIKILPDKIRGCFEQAGRIAALAKHLSNTHHFLFLGRGPHYAVALEGALKMKELTYIPSEGYSAAEMKHGPNALIEEGVPVVVIAVRDALYEKVLANIQEVRARGGTVIAIATAGDQEITKYAEEVFFVPETMEPFTPILTVIPLQLLAYYLAVALGRDVDKPRNLAKSVTVE
ncbi:MAG: glutamine--fructose-6-phosphate transaminase (isomerizing) [Candidatus Eisenbacteria bacterium]|uniref:Glutamine--fructose-6-phosphate aminotransferase [isomerizing] n=1 Tax=Eiseniibacteriota bacterium TaxID=2212470 RepID=A0A948RWN7_UNCEI|nr:glutamine--fructose-6-phosphate transaminase (isomerizing) [Candidatus Eisenbacteria bacterium]MBU1950093.1 glutamine--fructose-6-phosphate transaminase (isomerizing) [Candidatus Eisenbacteria bacterium]MBU2690402.1 glutamine--fructose-6-phosphate transaminase (isomerizing) [Candidatus Eisenbacteria bacterium]